jgi:hypothetical protein
LRVDGKFNEIEKNKKTVYDNFIQNLPTCINENPDVKNNKEELQFK